LHPFAPLAHLQERLDLGARLDAQELAPLGVELLRAVVALLRLVALAGLLAAAVGARGAALEVQLQGASGIPVHADAPAGGVRGGEAAVDVAAFRTPWRPAPRGASSPRGACWPPGEGSPADRRPAGPPPSRRPRSGRGRVDLLVAREPRGAPAATVRRITPR